MLLIVLCLFDKLPQEHSEFKLGDEVIPNVSPDEQVDEDILFANLREAQRINKSSLNNRCDNDYDKKILTNQIKML